jgi:hypothetical protein
VRSCGEERRCPSQRSLDAGCPVRIGSQVRDSTQSSWTQVPQLLLSRGEAKARVGLSHVRFFSAGSSNR